MTGIGRRGGKGKVWKEKKAKEEGTKRRLEKVKVRKDKGGKGNQLRGVMERGRGRGTEIRKVRVKGM